MTPYEILEHTADVGIRASGGSLREAFAAAAEALAVLLDAWFPGEGDERLVRLKGTDRQDLLAAWLDELLYLRDVHDLVFGGFPVRRVGERDLDALVRVASRGERDLEGTAIKAATYHRLRVEHDGEGEWIVEAYLDV